jgi:hypothetical protein
LPYRWIKRCLESVRDWCALRGCEYRFMGDELFDCVPESIREKTRNQPVIATDLARLLTLRNALNTGYDTVVWLDADVLVLEPSAFALPDVPCAFGREVWVQHDRHGGLKSYKKIHNAFLLFARGDSFLDFYVDSAERLLRRNKGSVPAQFIGPKLLTALHNVVGLPVLESAGTLSPMVIRNILAGAGPALDLFVKRSPQPIAAANLCASSCDRGELSEREMECLIDTLLGNADLRFGPHR